MSSAVPRPVVRRLATLIAPAGLGLLVACQTTPVENPDLDAARALVAQLRTEPRAEQLAAVELQRARQSLATAETAWSEKQRDEDVRHLAYLARRRAEIAQATLQQAQADTRAREIAGERERLRLEARSREAEAARAQASQAQQQATQAQQQASQARQQASSAEQQARQAAEAAAQEAQRAAALERDLKELQARPTPRGMVVTMGDVLFASGRAMLQPGAVRQVGRLAAVLQQYPERRVRVEGFTDSAGAETANLDLSARRAESFRAALVEAGVDPGRIEVQAYGEAYPVADNATAAGRQRNRRVEIVFSDPRGGFARR